MELRVQLAGNTAPATAAPRTKSKLSTPLLLEELAVPRVRGGGIGFLDDWVVCTHGHFRFNCQSVSQSASHAVKHSTEAPRNQCTCESLLLCVCVCVLIFTFTSCQHVACATLFFPSVCLSVARTCAADTLLYFFLIHVFLLISLLLSLFSYLHLCP